jgi:general secretion pathway protein I
MSGLRATARGTPTAAIPRALNRRTSRAAFTLLEVLVAIAILGLGLTAILSAQTGLFASSAYGERVSLATGLVRCKLSELELKYTKDGYPLVDTNDEGPCCADESTPGYSCKWKIEKIELPSPPTGGDLSSAFGSGSGTSSLGSIGAIAAVGQSNGAVLGPSAGLSDVSKLLSGQTPLGGLGVPGAPGSPSPFGSSGMDSFGSPPSAFGTVPGTVAPGAPVPAAGGLGSPMGGSAAGGLAPLVMSLVYPSLKPMLEASIRKLTVTVSWQQGVRSRDLAVTEFITNPMQGGLDPNAAQGLESAFSNLSTLLGGAAPGAGTPAAGKK